MTNEFNGKFGVGLNPWINMKVELLRNKTELKTETQNKTTAKEGKGKNLTAIHKSQAKQTRK